MTSETPLQDAVTLAADLNARLDPELEASIRIARVTYQHALAAFERLRHTGTKAEYLKAFAELTQAREWLELQEGQGR